MRRILVTGGAGSLGTHLIPRLLASHPEAVIESMDCDENRSAMLRRECQSPRLLVRVGDVRWSPLHEDTDLIYHLAARKHVQFGDDADAREVNVDATRRLLATGIPMVFASTDKAADPALAYGRDKRDAEDSVVAAGGWALRMCNLWMSNGSLPAMVADEVRRGATRVRAPRGIVRHYMALGHAAMLLESVAGLAAGR